MPKARQASVAQGSHFAISPWQSKIQKNEGTDAQNAYTVVEEDLLRGASPVKEGEQHRDLFQTSTATPLATGTAAAGNCIPTASAWISKRMERAEPRVPLVEENIDASHPSSPPLSQTTNTTLSGTAFLAIIGGSNSRIVGNFISADKMYPFHGRQVTSYRECTRDPEWSVVQLVFPRLPLGEVAVIAESNGGDAISLRAPVVWQGDELEMAMQQLDGLSSDASSSNINAGEGVELVFHCERLLVDAAADEELSRVMPFAVGMGAVVNIGPLTLKVIEK